MVILMFMSFASPLVSQAQSVSTPESPAPARMYHLLREEDDWSFLAAPAMRKDFWDPLVPATFVSHSFWLAAGTSQFQGQLINFCKNLAILGRSRVYCWNHESAFVTSLKKNTV